MLFRRVAKTKPTISAKPANQSQGKGKSIQDLIPLKDLESGLLITPDNKVVQCLKVSAINLELTSVSECNDIFEIFEGFLTSLSYPVQLTNVSMPIDLKKYITEQEELVQETENLHKKMLLDSYINYAKDIETSQEIMQRQRFIIITEQLKEDTPETRFNAILSLEEKKVDITSSLKEMELECEPVTDLDILRYLQTLFDYKGAQYRPIRATVIPDIVQGVE